MAKWCFQNTENVFNDIVLNKLKTVDPTFVETLLSLKLRRLILSQK